MKSYTDDELKARLLEDDYPNDDILLSRVIARIGNFESEARAMFEEWYETGKVRKFDVDGITPNWLRANHDMKDAGIIIAYDGLLKGPTEAARLLRKKIM